MLTFVIFSKLSNSQAFLPFSLFAESLFFILWKYPTEKPENLQEASKVINCKFVLVCVCVQNNNNNQYLDELSRN